MFLSADSLSGNIAGRNPYAYVGENPETYNDPSGLLACSVGGTICQVPPPPPSLPWNAVQPSNLPPGGIPPAVQPSNPSSGGTAQALVPFSPFAIHHTVVTTRPSSVFQVDSLNTCAPAGISQALCGNGHANYAVYLSTGGAIGLPGPFSLCPDCGPGGGPDDNSESRGVRDFLKILASDTGGELLGEAGAGGDLGGETGSGSFQNQNGTLVNADQALIDAENKFGGYLLNPDHPVGSNKAIVYERALGYNQSNYQSLVDQIRQGVIDNPAVFEKANEYGTQFRVDILITGPNGNTKLVETGWIYDPGSVIPRFVNAIVK